MQSLRQNLRAAARSVQGGLDDQDRAGSRPALGLSLQVCARPAVTIASPTEAKSGHIVISHKGEEVSVSAFEAYMFDWFGKDSAVIPMGVFLTSVILGSGLLSLQQKNRVNQQYAMRSRVIAQGITIGAMMTSLAVQERQKALGIIPKFRGL